MATLTKPQSPPTAKELEAKGLVAQAELQKLEQLVRERTTPAVYERALRRIGVSDDAFTGAEAEIDKARRRIDELRVEIDDARFAAAYLRYRSLRAEGQLTVPERAAISKRKTELIAEEVKEVCGPNTFVPTTRQWAELNTHHTMFANERLNQGVFRLTDAQLKQQRSPSSRARIAEWKTLSERDNALIQIQAAPNLAVGDLLKQFPDLTKVRVTNV